VKKLEKKFLKINVLIMDSNRNIEVTCPVCKIIKKISIPQKIFDQKRFGTIKVQVPQGGVCLDHQFIVFIDIKGIIRGYEKIDLVMKTPTETKKFSLYGFIKMFGLYGLFSLIHAKIFNYLSYVIKDEGTEDQSEIINMLGDSLLPEKYRGMNFITFIEDRDYNKIKKDKNILIIDSQKNILQTPWKTKLKFEEEIIKNALKISNEDEQRISIQNEIAKFIKEAEISKIIAEKEVIYETELIEKLSRELMIPKVNYYRISLIKEFIERRISAKLAQRIKNKVHEFLKSI